jgi:hypothetical protein
MGLRVRVTEFRDSLAQLEGYHDAYRTLCRSCARSGRITEYFWGRRKEMNGFYKACLLIIILLLAIIAFRPIVNPQPALAITHYQYLYATTTAQSEMIQAALDKHVAEGWELATAFYLEGRPAVSLIFRREAR